MRALDFKERRSYYTNATDSVPFYGTRGLEPSVAFFVYLLYLDEPIEFHASPIRKGKDFWRKVDSAKRQAVLDNLTGVLENANHDGMALFGAAVEKNAEMWGEKAVEYATEEICRRFDLFLSRHRFDGNT